jgi:hypothetical protein
VVHAYHYQTLGLFLSPILKGEAIRLGKNSANQSAYGNALIGNFTLLMEVFCLKFS